MRISAVVYSWWDSVKASCTICPRCFILRHQETVHKTGTLFSVFLISSLFAWPFSSHLPLAHSQLWLPLSSDSFLQHFSASWEKQQLWEKKKKKPSDNDNWKEKLKTMDHLAEWKPLAVFHIDFKLQNSHSCQLLSTCVVLLVYSVLYMPFLIYSSH